MNILQVQDRLKGLSEQQLAQEMQMPSGMAPQFLVLSELQRRKRVRDEFQAQQGKGQMTTVAQDAVAAAGVPQAPMAQMATAMAPQTDVTQNTGIAALPAAPAPEEPQMMSSGGPVRKMQEGRVVRNGTVYILQPDGSYLPEAEAPTAGDDLAAMSLPRLRAEYGAAGPGLGEAATDVAEGAINTWAGARSWLDDKYGDITSYLGMPGYASDFYEQSDAVGSIPEQLARAETARENAMTAEQERIRAEIERRANQTAGGGGGADAGRVAETADDAAAALADISGGGGADAGQAANPATTPAAPTPTAPATTDPAAAISDAGGSGSGSGSGGSGGMTSYEQAIADAIARADKRANQDKWLALAQAGMALMASKQPTLGGAVGEAGATGLAAFRQGRDEAEKTKMDLMGTQFEIDLARQKLAAAAAGGGGGGRGLSVKNMFDIFGKRVENAQIAFENARLSGDPNAMLEAKNRLEAATADYEGLYAQLGATQIIPEEDEVEDVTE